MKKYLIILFCLISSFVIAEQRTEAELCKIAQNVLPQSVKERHLIRSNKGKIELLSPKILYRTNALSFVGYSEGGFVVLSNESTNESVLGYSETCMPDTLPDGMQWWVDAMNSVLTDKTNIRRTPITAPHKIVEPLIETAWAQGFPYNNLIKMEYKGQLKSPPAGCVAIAMAQIIRYHKHPERGIGSHRFSKTYEQGHKPVWYETDFYSHIYDYDNLFPRYSRTDVLENPELGYEIEKFIYDCSIAVNTNYSMNGSGSNLKKVKDALSKYFDYEPTTLQYIRRTDTCTDEAWKQYIISELEANRPICYAAGNIVASSAHAFVIDGIDEEGLVHVNWGWSGSYNGYYDIDLLNPGSSIYTRSQNALLGIIPRQKPTETFILSAQPEDIKTGRVIGSGTYRAGIEVEITAIAQNGYRFKQWSDGSTEAVRNILLQSDTTIIAQFEERDWELTLYANSQYRGFVLGSGGYAHNAIATIEARPNPYWDFEGWALTYPPTETSEPFGGTKMNIVLTSDTTLYAIFQPKQKYLLDLRFSNPGIIQLDRSENFIVNHDTVLQTWAVHLEAIDPADYKFTKWSDGETKRTRDIILSSDLTLTAQYEELSYYNLSLTVEGNGKIVGNEAGTYSERDTIVIEAVAEHGYQFVRWSDGVVDAQRTLRLTSDTTLTAYFDDRDWEVNVYTYSTRRGTVTGKGKYAKGSTATIVATPKNYWHFVGWTPSKPTAKNKVPPSGEAEMSFTVNNDTSLYAVFEPEEKYNFHLKFSNPGMIYLDQTSNYKVTEDTILKTWNVYLTAQHTNDYKFVRWSDGKTTRGRQFLLKSDSTITAIYEERGTCSLSLSVEGPGKIEGATSGTYLELRQFKITAVPDEGYIFNGWSDGVAEAQRTLILSTDTVLIAYFRTTPVYYTLSITSENSVMGSVEGTGTYEEGTQATITATANDGYHFVSWSDGNTENPRNIIVEGDLELTALFEENPLPPDTFTLLLYAQPEEGGIVNGAGKYEINTTAKIEAIANEHYKFRSWHDGNATNPRNIIIDSDKEFTAIFSANKYVVTLSCNPTQGRVKGAGAYPYHSEVSIEAEPFEGFRFESWSDSNTDNPRTILVESDISLEALFVDQYTDLKTTENSEHIYPKIIIENLNIYIIMPDGRKYSIDGRLVSD